MLSELQTLSHYRIVKKLGEGGMGEVYLAEDIRLGRRVALKILPKELVEDTDRVLRLVDEARAASALNHPNILTIYEVGHESGIDFIASEYIEGETLRQRIVKPLPVREALEYAIAIAEALCASHEAGIIHRDIKPDNVMVRRDGYVKVLDFGVAKLLERDSFSDDGDTVAKPLTTDPGVVKGTMSYMSPEQLRGMSLDGRSDIFSLGIVLYEMLTGCAPFNGTSTTDTIVEIIDRDPPPLHFYRRDLPNELERIVTKALQKDRDDRYQTARDLRIDLRNLQQELAFEAREQRSSGSRTYPLEISSRSQDRYISASWFLGRTAAKRLPRLLLPALLVVILIGAVLYLRKPTREINSLAVLPFTSLQHDADTEYLSEGITESITHSLSRLPNLQVMARSSVYRYRGQEPDPRKIGSELNVEAILLGRIRRKGDVLIVQTDLVDTSNGTLIWGEKYQKKMADILHLQDEIAGEISDQLRVKLTGEERKAVTKRYTDDTEAYHLYLKGRFYWSKRTKDSLRLAIEFFQKAIERDPNYALAYSGLADAYALYGQYAGLPPAETIPRARAAAMRALDIDESLAEAHTSLGYAKFTYDWDWAGAEKEYRRAIALNPSYATAHHWLALYLAAMGRMDESITEMRHAAELDPLSPVISMNVGSLLYLAGRYDDALDQFRHTLELDPEFSRARYEMGRVLEMKGLYQPAIIEMKKATTVDEVTIRLAIARVEALDGRKARARKELLEVAELAKKKYVSPYDIAGVWVAIGDHDEAVRWLEKAYDYHLGRLAYIRIEPMFRPLHNHAGFQQLMRKVGH